MIPHNEFTRAMDDSIDFQERSDLFKTQKYSALHKKLEWALGLTWKVHTLSFTAGVKGSIPKDSWRKNLRILRIPEEKWEKLFSNAAKETFKALELIFAARWSAWTPGRTPGGTTITTSR